jgi:hypothetical protein
MDWNDYRSNAAECRRKAAAAGTKAEQREWLRMAGTWLNFIPSNARTREEDALIVLRD